MYSVETYPNLQIELDIASHRSEILSKICRENNLQGAFLIDINTRLEDFHVIATHAIPIEPFNGAEKYHLDAALKDCFSRHPKPHVHGISDLALSGVIKRFNKAIHGANKVWFVPFRTHETYRIFLGIPQHDSKVKTLPESLGINLCERLYLIETCNNLSEIQNRLRTTEDFSREIGHDISGSVQAVLAMAKTISQKRIAGDAILRKAREIELEILAIYRHSESLGIALNRNYEKIDNEVVDLVDIVSSVTDSYRNEAEERHLTIQITHTITSLLVIGDSRAISHAIGQIIFNAIKYANGSTTITVQLTDEGDYAALSVKDTGLHLPPDGPERKRIWDFGVRSEAAKELHVQGSGIGLFTVRKIVLAHKGACFADCTGHHPATVKIGFRLLKKSFFERNHPDELPSRSAQFSS